MRNSFDKSSPHRSSVSKIGLMNEDRLVHHWNFANFANSEGTNSGISLFRILDTFRLARPTTPTRYACPFHPVKNIYSARTREWIYPPNQNIYINLSFQIFFDSKTSENSSTFLSSPRSLPPPRSNRIHRPTRAGARVQNRFSPYIRFNFTLTSAQFSLHGYWPFSSFATPIEKRERERERLIRACFRSVRFPETADLFRSIERPTASIDLVPSFREEMFSKEISKRSILFANFFFFFLEWKRFRRSIIAINGILLFSKFWEGKGN